MKAAKTFMLQEKITKGCRKCQINKKFSNKNYGFIKYVKNVKGIISKVNLLILCANKNKF